MLLIHFIVIHLDYYPISQEDLPLALPFWMSATTCHPLRGLQSRCSRAGMASADWNLRLKTWPFVEEKYNHPVAKIILSPQKYFNEYKEYRRQIIK